MTADDLPLLVLLPGMDGTGRFFAPLQRALESRVESQIVPYPAFGPQSYDALSEAVLARLPAGRDYVLVAESFGGPLGVLVAARAERPPRGLILSATFARNPFPLLGGLLQFALPLLMDHAPAPALIETALIRPGDHAFAAELAQAATAAGPRLLQARSRSALTCNVQRELAALTVPILYLQGMHDKLVSPACGLLMKEIARDLRLVQVDAPHFVLQYDCETTVHNHILPFLHGLS